MKVVIFIMVVFLFFTSCSPVISYVGDNYSKTDSVISYFNAADIKIPYKSMGHLTTAASNKKAVVAFAKKKGADGVVFTDIEYVSDKNSTTPFIKAELIKFNK